MVKQYWNLLKTTGISPYLWTILGILPFYFIFSQLSSTIHIAIGITLTILFFTFYRVAFLSQRWPVYVWTLLMVAISVASTLMFSYVYFAFFIAYFIGNIHAKVPFFVLYSIHLASMAIAINFGLILKGGWFLNQLPFIIIVCISIIFLPFSVRHRKVRGLLEEKLEDANKRISELVKMQERQRIARDLHDTLGQKLSLIGLKSDLAGKLIYKDPEQAKAELRDVQQTARTALNEVRKMVSEMRSVRLNEELIIVEQILQAADIEFICSAELPVKNVSLLSENILSMCLKEAVTNVVKHSGAQKCEIELVQNAQEILLYVKDDGSGGIMEAIPGKGNGINGMRERLEFVNGTLDIKEENGTWLIISVPRFVEHEEQEGVG